MIKWILLLLVSILPINGCNAQVFECQTLHELLYPTPQPDWVEKKITLFYSFAGADPTTPDKISFGWGVGYGSGYERFFMEEVDNTFTSLKEHYKDGVRSFWVHLPQGRLPGWPMQFDMNAIIDDYIAKGKFPPGKEIKIQGKYLSYWCARFLHDCPDAEITFYYGALDVSAGLVSLDDNPQAYMNRVMKSVKPFTDLYDVYGINRSRTHIYFDHLGGGETDFKTFWNPACPKNSKEHSVIQFLRSFNYRVGVEPHSFNKPQFEHLYDYATVIGASHWYRASAKRDVKPLITGNVAVMCLSSREADDYGSTLIKDKYVDEIVVSKYRYDKIVGLQEEYKESLNGN